MPYNPFKRPTRAPVIQDQNTLAIQFLHKVSKGIKGSFNVLVIQEAFKHLAGWQLESVVTADLIKEHDYTPIWKTLDFNAVDRFNPFNTTTKDMFSYGYWVYPTKEQAEKGRDWFQSTCDITGKDGPANPVVGRVYYTKILPVAPAEQLPFPRVQHKGMYQFGAARFWLGVEGWLVTAPNGKSYAFNQPLTLRKPSHEFTTAGFWAFVYGNGLGEDVKAFLKAMDAEEIEKAVHPSTFRTLANIGTCPVCFANIKLINSRISRHGWEVQGKRRRGEYWNTMHSGPCYGYQYEPFEISPKGSEDYLAKVLEPSRDRHQRDLQVLQRKPAESYTVQHPVFMGKEITVLKGTPEYEKHWKMLVVQLEQIIEWLEADIREMRAKVASWKPQPLPGMKKTTAERLAHQYLSRKLPGSF